LTNARLSEQYRATKIKAARKLQRNVHDYSGEDTQSSLLRQYDDPLGDQEHRGLTIGETGEFKAPIAVAHLSSGETLDTPKALGREFSLPKRLKKGWVVVKPTKVSQTEMQDVYSQRRLAAQTSKVIEEEEHEVARSLSLTLLSRRRSEVVLLPSTPETLDEGVEFSDTMEFLQNVHVEPRSLTQMGSGALSVTDARGGTTSVLNVALLSKRVRF
jgi:hypothetical protein